MNTLSRRDLFRLAPAAVALAAVAAEPPAEPFRFCLNTSTIRGQKRSLIDEVTIAAEAGFQGIEPWINEIDRYVQSGGSLPDLRKRITDAGLVVPDAIGFPEWIVDDPARRAKGIEEAKRAMGLMQQLGGTHLAAPPVGATQGAGVELGAAADRYHALCELGDRLGVVPIVEMWGFSKNLAKLGEVLCVAAEAHHPKACVLPDVYHLHKGGSEFDGVRLLRADTIGIFHVNDYPADVSREQLADKHRVFPGDGVAPLTALFGQLRAIGYRGMVSLELFNVEYWKRDAREVAKEGLAKLKAVAHSPP